MYRSLWIDDEVAALRDMARKFFDIEGAPNRERWEQQQHVDREFWLKAAKLGQRTALALRHRGISTASLNTPGLRA